MDLPNGKGTVVDMTGTDAKTGKKARLVGIISPQLSETWFYKLMGDEQIEQAVAVVIEKGCRAGKADRGFELQKLRGGDRGQAVAAADAGLVGDVCKAAAVANCARPLPDASLRAASARSLRPEGETS